MSYVLAPKGIVEKYPYSFAQLRKDNPATSFPRAVSDAFLAKWGLYTCTLDPAPSFDPLTETIYRRPPSRNEQGDWVVTWAVEQLPELDTAARVRLERNTMLAQSDWIVAVSYERGEPVPRAWADYRQVLRDLPQQPGFPFTVTWPVEPE
jgi:hypothetical protein